MQRLKNLLTKKCRELFLFWEFLPESSHIKFLQSKFPLILFDMQFVFEDVVVCRDHAFGGVDCSWVWVVLSSAKFCIVFLTFVGDANGPNLLFWDGSLISLILESIVDAFRFVFLTIFTYSCISISEGLTSAVVHLNIIFYELYAIKCNKY